MVAAPCPAFFTSAYKEAEGQPIVVRRAMAFKKVLEELPISIEEDELLVGHTAAEPLARELYPDMAANFEGKEEIRKLLLTAPKYGNDDDYVDEIARDLYKSWAGIGKETGSFYGQKCRLSPYSITRFYPIGSGCQCAAGRPPG